MARTNRNDLDRYKDQPQMRTFTVATVVWEQAKARARRSDTSAAKLLTEAVESELEHLLRGLERLHVSRKTQPDKRVRVPLSRNLLDRLQQARARTGLPGNHIATLCLKRHLLRKRRRPRSEGTS